MNPTVYNHHVARISKTMLRRSTERLLESGEVAAEDVRRMDDHELLVAIRDCDDSAEMARRLARRDLLKRAVWAEMDDVPGDVVDADPETIREHEREVARAAEVDPGEVVLDVPERPSMTESSSRVIVSGEVRRLDRQSPLVSALRTAQRNQWRLGVFAPADLTDRVGAAAEDVLGLDVDGALVTDVRPGLHATLDEFGDD
jgi:HD superfamily phosphohydrolase